MPGAARVKEGVAAFAELAEGIGRRVEKSDVRPGAQDPGVGRTEILTGPSVGRQPRPVSIPVSIPARKLPLYRMAAVAIVLVVLAALSLRGVDLRGLAEQGLALIRRGGPTTFFVAMTILPAFGVPMGAFTIPAGEAFGAQIGLPAVITLALGALAVNLALGYWVARYALRPPLLALLTRFGYAVPRITPENALSVTLVVRLTPGPPYMMQACILGVAQAPFRLYMIVSWLAMMPWAVGAIILGKGLFNGNYAVVMAGLSVLIVFGVLVQWLRRKFARREDRA
jgi:uncharacterized membrane protein YdjX (TVP38/TMEM64 family)